MIKYTDSKVTFAEIPDEISLCINISNCLNNCVGCHSPNLKKDIGEKLTLNVIDELIENNNGITCICFMGLGNDIESLESLIKYIHQYYKDLNVAIYSGDDYFEYNLMNIVDYYKIGHYDKKLGPLNNPNTNQRLFKITNSDNSNEILQDITYKFWNKF